MNSTIQVQGHRIKLKLKKPRKELSKNPIKLFHYKQKVFSKKS